MRMNSPSTPLKQLQFLKQKHRHRGQVFPTSTLSRSLLAFGREMFIDPGRSDRKQHPAIVFQIPLFLFQRHYMCEHRYSTSTGSKISLSHASSSLCPLLLRLHANPLYMRLPFASKDHQRSHPFVYSLASGPYSSGTRGRNSCHCKLRGRECACVSLFRARKGAAQAKRNAAARRLRTRV